MPSPLRVLWISPVCPAPPTDGNRQRNFHLLSGLAGRHAVTLLCPAAGEEAAGLRDLCRAVVTVPAAGERPGALRRALRRLEAAARRRPDCFLPPSLPLLARAARRAGAEEPFDAVFGGLYVAPAVRAASARARVLDDQNVEAELYARLFRSEPFRPRKLARLLDWWAVSGFERSALRWADAVTVCSRRDGERLRRSIPGLGEPRVVPNGADLAGIPFHAGPRDPDLLLMVGGMAYAPNVDGARMLVREVMPAVWRARPGVRLAIVGKEPAPAVRALAGPRVAVTGAVPDVRPYLASAALEVVPLRSGGGTRLKILEAMAAGLPLVSTSVGAEGLDLDPSAEIRLADGPAALAGAILSLLADPAGAARMAAAARRRVETDYAWTACAERLAAVIEGAAAASAGSAACRS